MVLSSEFNNEMGALIRSLESQVRQHPDHMYASHADIIDSIDRAIVSLIAYRIALKEAESRQG